MPRLPALPFLPPPPALPALPPPPVPVPGRGLVPAQQLLAELAPPLTQSEEIYLRTVVELAAGLLGVQPAELEAPDASLLAQLLFSPNKQVRELQQALAILAEGGVQGGGGGSSGSSSSGTGGSQVAAGGNQRVAREMAAQVVDGLMERAAARLSVGVDTLFPMRRSILAALA